MNIDHLDTPEKRQIAIWILRLFSKQFTYRSFAKKGSYTDHDIVDFLRLPRDATSEMLDREIPAMMAAMLMDLENIADHGLHGIAEENLSKFRERLQLNEVEAAVVRFFVALECHAVLGDSIRILDDQLNTKPGEVLSLALDHSEVGMTAALQKSSRMVSSGVLVKGEPRLGQWFKWRFFSRDLAINLLTEPYDVNAILLSMGVMKTNPPKLKLSDYPHLKELPILTDYLGDSIKQKRKGVNILLHGDPGTGKTELTRAVAKALGIPLYDFATEDSEGEPIRASLRLNKVRFASSFLSDCENLFVFDEFEDILDFSGFHRGEAGSHKGWFNRLLETNSAPIFWLSNSISHLDPAYVRRFDFIIEMPIPPRSQRTMILRENAGRHLSEETIERLANIENLAPAVVNRISTVFDHLSSNTTVEVRDEMFCHMANSVLKAQGRAIPKSLSNEIIPADVYDTAHLNTNSDLPGIARMLRENPHARLCLHGPPGTGKTAFGHWLSREIDRPLHVTHASDLLSAFLGDTEKNIAKSFETALHDEAILMIDEVDSFLQDRGKAVRSWEVTQVNQLLTCMESFNGIFIATTNRLAHLDSASLRRFDLKLHFDYLDAGQIEQLFRAWCLRLGIAPPNGKARGMIDSMKCVTPGDFAAVARRHRFQPFATAADFLCALAEDCAIKAESSRQIGFQ